MIEYNLDVLLSLAARVSWAFFIIYALVVLVRSAQEHGIRRAGLELLTYRVLLPLLLPVAVTLLSMSVVFVQPQQVGVVVSILVPGGVRPESLPAGLHLIIPFLEYDTTYPISWQTYTMSSRPTEGDQIGDDSIRARTSDGQEVLIDTSVIFRVDGEQAVSIYRLWQDRYTSDFVRPVMRGFVRRQVSQFTVEEVNSSARKDLEQLLDRLLDDEFADKGFILDQFLLRDITFTDTYADAVENKQAALEGIEQAQNEAQQRINIATGNASAIEIEAGGRANAIKLEAEAQAEALKLIAEALETNEQLLTYSYIEKLTPNIEVMLLPADAPFLFPLPELGQQDSMTPTVGITTTILPEITLPEPTATVVSPTIPVEEPVPNDVR